ncbi:diguanylate cyclase [Pseudomonas sp. MAFF 311095]|uniref:diguanylate cyclase n=1 Tax=Pseudomonas petroselini TaxID=2899822 RepID=A0ABS8R316_9PSED|nr:diguanylate cyclase [Pseudomonas petroselini]MCD7042090.1 diguanylate cyclase [Pseudomonas petroselini]MCD7048503.1 diguanylate cyclase [Pseudomonas petroselini]MCD7066638.1 diguanylate cyclase [Pseudomonas petroselini]MCD7078506.1 diguanylate cyclase [Pseudomonas petroselini]
MPNRIDHSEKHRRMMLKSLLWTTLCFGIFFSLFNANRGYWLLAGLELAYAFISLYMLMIIDRTKQLQALTIIYLLPFFTVMMFTLASPETSVGIFAWIQTIPIILYLLLGLRLGLIGSLLFVSLGLYMITRHHAEKSPVDDIGFVLDIGLATLAITIFSHTYERTRVLTEQRLIELVTTDHLTGLANRAKLAEVFQRESEWALRNGSPLALVYLDIDHFKQINDRFGHDAGDQALCHFASVLTKRLRATDLLCRLGGEEFAALLPEARAEQAMLIAETLREHLAATPLELIDQQLNMTLSAGVAVFGSNCEHLDDLLKVADGRAYAAKRAGRNRVVGIDPPPQTEIRANDSAY